MRRKKGFSLSDIMITMLLVGLGIIAVVRYMPLGVLASKISQNNIVAANLAQRELELVSVQDFANVNTVSKSNTIVSGYEKEITVSLIRADLKKVTVKIYYPVPSLSGSKSTKTMQFATYKSNR